MSTKQGSAVPWSYSSLTAYETCPRRFYLTRIIKAIKEPQTEATLHGNEVHKALELYVGGMKGLPDKYDAYRAVADKIRNTVGEKKLEYKFGLTKALKPCGFFDGDVWVRGVLDVNIIRPSEVIILDYKTGKRKLDGDQMRLFAGAGLNLWPFAKKVKTGYIWLQTGQIDSETFTPDDSKPIMQEFAMRVHRMEESQRKDDWPAKPSGLCANWCPVGRTNCEHCGKP